MGADPALIAGSGLGGGELLVDVLALVHGPLDVDQAFHIQVVHEGNVLLHVGVAEAIDDVAVGVGLPVMGNDAERGGEGGLDGRVADVGDHVGVGFLHLAQDVDELGQGQLAIGILRVQLKARVLEQADVVGDAAGDVVRVELRDAADLVAHLGRGPLQVVHDALQVGSAIQIGSDVDQGALGSQGVELVLGHADDVVLGAGAQLEVELLISTLAGEHVVGHLVAGQFFDLLGRGLFVRVGRAIAHQVLEFALVLGLGRGKGHAAHQPEDQGQRQQEGQGFLHGQVLLFLFYFAGFTR